MAENEINTASREIYWNITAPHSQFFMYLLFALGMGVFVWGVYRRIVLWREGTADSSRRGMWLQRFSSLFTEALLQRGVNREREARKFHSLIFFGFLVLLFTTTTVFIDYDLGWKIYHGRFYLAVTLLSDLFGFGLILGVSYAYYLRVIAKPDRLHSSRADFAALGLLALLCIQGFALEALRIRATDDPWALYSPIGYVSSFFFWSLNEKALRILHVSIWWFHTVTVFATLALIPYTKFFHVIASSINLFFKPNNRPHGALGSPGDIEELMTAALEGDSDDDFRVGVSTVNDLSWKQRLDLDSCTSCGRCQAACPAYNSGKDTLSEVVDSGQP